MPVELTHKNHFRFGYDREAFSFRQSSVEKWWVQYGACERAPGTFYEECLATAELIRSKTDLPIFILFSGGVDSEVVLRSFVEAKITVTAAIMRFNNDLNIHDISYAVIACESLNVPYRFFDLNILDFWQNGAGPYAAKTRCFSPQLIATMWLMDQIPGYLVMGSGECLLVRQSAGWDLWEKERIASWYRHLMIRKRNGCPAFFQYTPEIMLSYLQDPLVQRLVKNEFPEIVTTEGLKLEIYQQHFNLISRKKFTGFEKLQAEDAILRTQLKKLYSDSDQIVKTDMRELVPMLNPRSEYKEAFA